MTKDRIEQLRAVLQDGDGPQQIDSSGNHSGDEEEKVNLMDSRNKKVMLQRKKIDQNQLDDIFKEVNQTQAWIEIIEEEVLSLKKFHSAIQQLPRADSSTKEKLDHTVNNIKSTSTKVRTYLQVMERRKSAKFEGVVQRVIATQHAVLVRRYLDAMSAYQTALVSHKEKCDAIITRQLQIVVESVTCRCVAAGKMATQEDIERLLDSEDTAVFVDNYVKETLNARQTLQDARDRHQELLALEKSILEVNTLFTDLALLVENQGELIDRIEYHVGNGIASVEKGRGELVKADNYKAKARRRKITLICLLSALLVLVLLVIIKLSLFKRD